MIGPYNALREVLLTDLAAVADVEGFADIDWNPQPIVALLDEEEEWSRGLGIAANRIGPFGSVDAAELSIVVTVAASGDRSAADDAAAYADVERASKVLHDLADTAHDTTDGCLSVGNVSESLAVDSGLYINTVTLAASWVPA